MPLKNIRIIVVDNQLWRHFFLEKVLNNLGYYRIAFVTSYSELISINGGAFERIDFLIANIDSIEDTLDAKNYIDRNFASCQVLKYREFY